MLSLVGRGRIPVFFVKSTMVSESICSTPLAGFFVSRSRGVIMPHCESRSSPFHNRALAEAVSPLRGGRLDRCGGAVSGLCVELELLRRGTRRLPAEALAQRVDLQNLRGRTRDEQRAGT